MSTRLVRARRWAIMLAGLVSVAAALAAVMLFAPGFFARLRTAEMAAAVALLVLPGLMFGLVRGRVGAGAP